jgi:hypothetical protein
MKSLLLIILLSSFSLFASEETLTPKLCYTHGQCQDSLPEIGYKCFIVKLGTNPNGSPACTLRCPSMPMGSYCENIQGHAFGICKKESYSIPAFDPNDCSNAIDADEL